METLGSARIEGNNTTLSEYVEKIIEKNTAVDEKGQELQNIDQAIKFIEEHTDETTKIDRAYISELHKMVTKDLTPPPQGEGSNHPGAFRPIDVDIQQANHTPPSHIFLPQYFDVFLNFINEAHLAQNQLLMVAIAHHRFAYIHPFDNGNGRLGRLLNYAFLIKLGFNVKAGRIVNPSSIFYSDRDKYYEMLGKADTLDNQGALDWSEYFLSGLRDQIEKIDSLTQSEFTRDKILFPTIKYAFERMHITKQEFEILSYLIKTPEMAIKSSELEKIGIKKTQQKTYAMKKLKEKRMISPTKENGRIYTIIFANNYLLRSIIKTLKDNGFVAEFLNQN